jgi:hypothetical protein
VHGKKLSNSYRYAVTRTAKGNFDVPDGFAKILNKGITPHYDWIHDYGTKIYVPFEKFFKTKCYLDTDTLDPYAPNGRIVHKHPRHALPPLERKEGTNLTTRWLRQITYGAAGSQIENDEESDIIEANVVENEMNDCDFANEIHLCEHC